MINLSSWPFDRPAEERQLLAEALNQCETDRQVEVMLGAFLLGDLLTDILLTPPVWREHWWQVWRLRKPEDNA